MHHVRDDSKSRYVIKCLQGPTVVEHADAIAAPAENSLNNSTHIDQGKFETASKDVKEVMDNGMYHYTIAKYIFECSPNNQQTTSTMLTHLFPLTCQRCSEVQ